MKPSLRKWVKRLFSQNYAIIYDTRQPSGDDNEEYYGYFTSKAEAQHMFNEAFGLDDSVHNAILVRCIKQLKPWKD